MKRKHKVVNLGSMVSDAIDGHFANEQEIKEAFMSARLSVDEFESEAIAAFERQRSCKHKSLSKPYYQIKNCLSGYYYDFQKNCLDCGKHFSVTSHDGEFNESNPPEGFENPERHYYNTEI